jgi:hypothetical protein
MLRPARRYSDALDSIKLQINFKQKLAEDYSFPLDLEINIDLPSFFRRSGWLMLDSARLCTD